jgi:hypothetical protein
LDFLKLHHLQVVHETALACEYSHRPFALLRYDEYVDLVVEFLELLNPAIRLERLFGFVPEQYLIGPHWNATRGEIQQGIERALAARGTWQGRRYPR